MLLVTGQLASRQPGTQVALSLDEVVDGAEDFLVVHSLVLPDGFAHLCIPPVGRRGSVLPTVYFPAMQLSRKRIIAAAIELIEAAGAEAVSMDRLATELGCGVISLYCYVPSKNALLDGVADEVMSRLAGACSPAASWQDQLRAQARAFREVATAHPRCTMVALSRRPVSAAAAGPAERALATLRAAGFSGPDTVRIVRAFAAYILGWLLREVGLAPELTDSGDRPCAAPRLRRAEFPQFTQLYPDLRASDPDGDFEFGLDLLVHAVTARAS